MNVNIVSGEIKITINDDKTRLICFNPNDIAFADKFYNLLAEFEEKQHEFKKRAEEIDNSNDVDEFGIGTNIKSGLNLTRDVCEYLKNKIDEVFGIGTSMTAFGDTLEIDMFQQFFEGVIPLIEKARANKLNKYARNSLVSVMK